MYTEQDASVSPLCVPQVSSKTHEGLSRALQGTRVTRRKRRLEDSSAKHDDMDPTIAALEREHEEITKVKNIGAIQLGRWEIDTWYFSPYPDEYCCDKLYVCEYTLKYMKKASALERHKVSVCLAGCDDASPLACSPVFDSASAACGIHLEMRSTGTAT